MGAFSREGVNEERLLEKSIMMGIKESKKDNCQ